MKLSVISGTEIEKENHGCFMTSPIILILKGCLFIRIKGHLRRLTSLCCLLNIGIKNNIQEEYWIIDCVLKFYKKKSEDIFMFSFSDNFGKKFEFFFVCVSVKETFTLLFDSQIWKDISFYPFFYLFQSNFSILFEALPTENLIISVFQVWFDCKSDYSTTKIKGKKN